MRERSGLDRCRAGMVEERTAILVPVPSHRRTWDREGDEKDEKKWSEY
uniref:Uncharacterized protein n=1 Tax=Nelumbo nucifera TaxID=4432 RepID=A0A822Y772_NELNU|nr:TPA_asm: hypothetical protein HUJ06_029818 [Nelumbo nucifera]